MVLRSEGNWILVDLRSARSASFFYATCISILMSHGISLLNGRLRGHVILMEKKTIPALFLDGVRECRRRPDSPAPTEAR